MDRRPALPDRGDRLRRAEDHYDGAGTQMGRHRQQGRKVAPYCTDRADFRSTAPDVQPESCPDKRH
jgi:hypothetical protein